MTDPNKPSFLEYTEEHLKMLNDLAHTALKSAGVEAYQIVKKLEAWLATAKKQPTENVDESKPSDN